MPSAGPAVLAPRPGPACLRAVPGALALLVLAACTGGHGHRDLALFAPRPGITSFAPGHAQAYSRIELAGHGLAGATAVAFAGVPATRFVAAGDQTLYAGVPPGAGSGLITVTTPAGVLESPDAFQFDPGRLEPSLNDVLPKEGPVGTRVTLRGSGLFSVETVTFGGVPAPFTPSASDSELEVRVPAGAHSGAITVALPNGAQASSRPFEVRGRPPQAPVITGFKPETGEPGTSLEVDGTHFATAVQVRIGGEDARFRIWSDTRIQAWVPASAPPSGLLSVTSPTGTGTHPTPFILAETRPVLRDFFPRAGTPGTEVLIEGEHLHRVIAVRFGPARSTGLYHVSETELRAAVPTDAATGPVTLETRTGRTVSSRDFRVTAADPGLQARIQGLYVTQATQRLHDPVPLVANRDGLLRVFLQADRPNAVVPGLEVTLLDGHGLPVLVAEAFATGPGLPQGLDENSLPGSWNLPLPGRLLQPGVSLRVRVLPAPGLDLPPEGLALPEDGTALPVNVVKVPPIGITLIPIASKFGTGKVTGAHRTLASWTDRFKRMYPVDEVDVEVASPHYTSLDLDAGDDVGVWVKLRDQLEVERLATERGKGRYHYGVFVKPPGGHLQGLGNLPPDPWSIRNRTAIGADEDGRRDGENYPEVLCHELGHCLDRRHAPCGGAGAPDFHYPYPGGVIGAPGLDVKGIRALDGRLYADVMGYCSPVWVSDYTYKGVLDWLLRQAKGPGALALAPPQPGLVIWGSIRHGVATLEPVFGTPACDAPPQPGDYTLKALDGAGHVLFRTAFAPDPVPDAPEGHDPGASFLFIIPDTPDLQARLATLEVTRAGAVLATLRATAPGHAAVPLPRDPVGTAWGPGQVLLTWDPATHPRVLVKDAATGESLGMADHGSATLPTEARELEVILSDNLRTTTRRIAVRP